MQEQQVRHGRGAKQIVLALALSLLVTGCALLGGNPATAIICNELEIREPGPNGDVVIRERQSSGQELGPSIEAAREECPELFPQGGSVYIISHSEATRAASACRIVVDASTGSFLSADGLEKLADARAYLGDMTIRMPIRPIHDDCMTLPLDLDEVLVQASIDSVCDAIAASDDNDSAVRQRERALDRLVSLQDVVPQATLDVAWKRCEATEGDVRTLRSFIFVQRTEIAAQAVAEEEEANRAAEERAAEAREQAEQAERDRRAQIDPALLRCYDACYEAGYLSSQALQAATCIVDRLFFGGVTPSDANTSELLPEIIFHATWATWDSTTRLTYCLEIKQRGFDAAEIYGKTIARTWQAQIRDAGSAWRLDDFDLVLDLLDTCEQY